MDSHITVRTHLIEFLKENFGSYYRPKSLGFGNATFYVSLLEHLANEVYDRLSMYHNDPPPYITTVDVPDPETYQHLADSTAMWLYCPISEMDSSGFSNALQDWFENDDTELVSKMILAYHQDGGPEYHFAIKS